MVPQGINWIYKERRKGRRGPKHEALQLQMNYSLNSLERVT